jgi:hypothetical protein
MSAYLTAATIEFRHFEKKYQNYYEKEAKPEENKGDYEVKVRHFTIISDQSLAYLIFSATVF